MDDNKIACNQTYMEIDESIVKIEEMKHEQNFNPENLDINFVEISPAGEYNSNVATMPKFRSRRCNKSSPLILPKIHREQRSVLKKERFRPIRPKPLQLVSTVVRHKYGLPPVMNITALPSNRVLVPHSVPIKEKCTTDVSNKTNNCIKPNSSNNINNNDNSNINIVNSDTNNDSNNSNTLNILSGTKENDVHKIVKAEDSNTTSSNCNNNSNSSNTNSSNNSSNDYNNCDKDLHTANAISKSHKNSIELFFESMAQTVLNLPNEVQADIKMQICKIVTMAEIKYCGSRVKDHKIEN